MSERITQTKKIIVLADGKEYEIKPLTLKESKDVIPLLKQLDNTHSELSEEIVSKTADLCFLILKKSIPELTIERVLDLVDLANVQKIILIASGKEV